MRGVARRPGEPAQHGFLHPTFGELFTAMAIQRSAEGSSSHLADAAILLARRAGERDWEVVTLLCGLAEDPGGVVQALTREAARTHQQELLRLAANCVRDCWTIPPEVADDLRMRILDAFKNWDIPFDYDLMRAGKATLRGVGRNFPARLLEDMDYFVRKYAEFMPDELRTTNTNQLLSLLGGDEPSIASDAAHTLGRRTYGDRADRDRVVAALRRCARECVDQVREQALSALKELAAPDALPDFVRVLEDTQETPRAKVYALNGIARIGDLNAADTVMTYMKDHHNPYRDSASWSLQALGLKAREDDQRLFVHIKQTFLSCLLRETSDEAGRYAKGNMLYSLGKLGATEYVAQIEDFLRAATDDYVIEDGVYAVALLRSPSSATFLRRYLTHADPAVRMKAAEGLAALGDRAAAQQVAALLHDPFEIVREAASAALARLAAAPPAAAYGALLASLRSPLRRLPSDVTVQLGEEEKALLDALIDELLGDGLIRTRPGYAAQGTGFEGRLTIDTYNALIQRIEIHGGETHEG